MSVAFRRLPGRTVPVSDEGRMPTPAAWADLVAVPENRSAVRAARRLARALTAPGRPVTPFAPLVLHGPPGTGKSAVAAALVRTVIAGPAVRTAQTLPANDLDDPDADFADLRAADLLVLEDLQHLPPRAADGVCRLLDARTARRRPTVVTANAGPAKLTALPRRLTSRLAAGLVVQLEPLSAASRRRVLDHLADRRGLRLTPDALAWLADRPTGGGVRPLLGVLEKLKVTARTRPGPLDRAAVEDALADPDANNGRPIMDAIVAKVAAAFGVKPKDMLGPSRLRTVMVPRQVAMYLAREVGKLPLVRVGEAFGGRDHSTVLHALRKVEVALAADAELAGKVRQLRAELG